MVSHYYILYLQYNYCMVLLPHLLPHIMFMSCHPFVYTERLQTLQFLLLFLCLHAPYIYTLVIFIDSLLHVYAG